MQPIDLGQGKLVLYEAQEGSCDPCGCSPRCRYLVWTASLAVRDMRGQYMTVSCAVSKGLTTWEEVKEHLNAEKSESPPEPAHEPARAGAGESAMEPEDDLGRAALANAPPEVRERMMKG